MLHPNLIGRLHPLLVHLPIGILLFAVGLMMYGRLKKVDVEAAVSLAWGLGALSAMLACGAGWLLAQSGEYDTDLVARHQWAGLITAGLATVTFLLKQHRWLPAFATVGLLSVAGHYGGNLTHGEDYLFAAKKPQTRTDSDLKPTMIAESAPRQADSATSGHKSTIRRTSLYRDQITPILKTRCYSCHSAVKKKGGLRLDSEEFIRRGGKNGRILTAGNPQKSKLFTYLLLPQDDDLHMPPRGKRQPTPQQMAVIQYWIRHGASFREQVEVVQPADRVAAATDVVPALPPLLRPEPRPSAIAESQPTTPEPTVLDQPVDAPSQDALVKLKQQQVALSTLEKGANYLSANFVNVKTFAPELLTDLVEVSRQVVHLRLADQPVDDAALKQLTPLKNLMRLNLENTRITDAGLRTLSALPNLEQLNLYGTAVTDAGLDALARYPHLKVVYLWQTQTTPEGIRRLQKARPALKIETGSIQLTRPDTNKTR